MTLGTGSMCLGSMINEQNFELAEMRSIVACPWLQKPAMRGSHSSLLVKVPGCGKCHRTRLCEVAVLASQPYVCRYHENTPNSDNISELIDLQAQGVSRNLPLPSGELADRMQEPRLVCQHRIRSIDTPSGRSIQILSVVIRETERTGLRPGELVPVGVSAVTASREVIGFSPIGK